MRLLIEIDRSADGRYEGTVLSAGGPVPVAFSGTLELLKVLEDSTSATFDPSPPPEIGLRAPTHPAERAVTRTPPENKIPSPTQGARDG